MTERTDISVQFKGQCFSCKSATPTSKSATMLCNNMKAWNKGLKTNGGGSKFFEEVSKLFGCIYWVDYQRK